MKPEQIASMALTVQPGTEMAKQVETGEVIQAAPLQILGEEKHLLKNLAGFETIYWGEHGSKILMPSFGTITPRPVRHGMRLGCRNHSFGRPPGKGQHPEESFLDLFPISSPCNLVLYGLMR